MSFRKRKTCRRYNTPGEAHSLTFSCFHGHQFLSKDRTRMWLIEALAEARRELHFDLWAYVIMPEHCHILLLPREEKYSISRILAAIKVPVTRRAKHYLEVHAPEALRLMRDVQPNGKVCYRFWQRGGGHDRNMYTARAIHAEIEYIHGNPVRRELVRLAEDWTWSSAGYFAGRRDVLLPIDAESIPPLYPT
jgi:putative transposase